MLAQVKIGTAMDAFNLFKAEWKLKFDIKSGISIMGQLGMLVEAVFFRRGTQSQVPLQAGLLPVLKPFFLRTRANKELHLHLLKLAHTDNELACNNLVPESFTDLRDTKRDLHTA